MSSQPSLDEIKTAIENSGYLLEQHVATQLENLGYSVRTNVAFEDPDQGKSREIDVRAIKTIAFDKNSQIGAYVDFIVECKNSSNPLVFISRPRTTYDKNHNTKDFVLPFAYCMEKDLGDNRKMSRELDPFNHLRYDQVYADVRHSWKAVQFCRIDRKGGGWHANHGGLYDATFFPMAKAVTAQRSEIVKINNRGGSKYIWLIFPLVVTTSKLLNIDSSKDDFEIEEVENVRFVREIKSGSLSGHFSVTFVNDQSLQKYIENVVNPVLDWTKQLVTEEKELLKKQMIPWVD